MEGDYLQHFNHPDKLKLQNEIRVFNCDGCMERGWGPRYKCEKCNYHLHKDCALAAASKTHMFYKRCTFNLWLNGSDDTYCIACEKVVVGYVYYCNTNGYYLHPCCAYLPLSLEGEGYVLQLHPSLSAKCGRCGRKDKTWSYRNKDYHYHVSCLNDMTIEKCEKKYLSMIAESSFSMEITMVPNLQLTRYRDKTSLKDKMKKIAKVIRNLFITSVTGDPTGGAILMKSVL